MRSSFTHMDFRIWLECLPDGVIANGRDPCNCPMARFLKTFHNAEEVRVAVGWYRVKRKRKDRISGPIALDTWAKTFIRKVDGEGNTRISKRVALQLFYDTLGIHPQRQLPL